MSLSPQKLSIPTEDIIANVESTLSKIQEDHAIEIRQEVARVTRNIKQPKQKSKLTARRKNPNTTHTMRKIKQKSKTIRLIENSQVRRPNATHCQLH